MRGWGTRPNLKGNADHKSSRRTACSTSDLLGPIEAPFKFVNDRDG